MKAFITWREARDYAEAQANATRMSFGIEKPHEGVPSHMTGWTVRLLPKPQFRQGFELRCEVVDPAVLR